MRRLVVGRMKQASGAVGLSLFRQVEKWAFGFRSPIVAKAGYERTAPFCSAASGSQPPQIELEFIGPEPEGSDGKYPVERLKVTSGEKLLRDFMLENNIDLYPSFRKLTNCRGRGLCGTCLVEILEGKDLLSERSKAEFRKLSQKPESWRLACQTRIGDGEKSGKIVVQRHPQFKK